MRAAGCVGAVAAVLTVGVLTAQTRETLETKVVVSGTEVTFKWSKKHPWDAALVANGVALFAEYRTTKGLGIECLQPNAPVSNAPGRNRAIGSCYTGTPASRSNERTITFQLPETLAAEPVGAVCLQLRLPDQRLLPIRQASKSGEDTARFQFEEWSRFVALRARAAGLDARRAELTTAVATQRREVEEQELSNRSKGWTSLDACRTQTGGTVEIARSGRPIAPPNEQDAIARQVCVARVANGADRTSTVRPPDAILSYLDAIDGGLRAKWLELRGGQLRQFRQDWTTFGPTIASYKGKHPTLPHFGTHNDRIPIQSLAQLSLALADDARDSKTAPDPQDVFGYAGATVEAYNRCVADGKEQLALNYTQSTQLAATVDALPERLRQQAVQACQAGVGRLATMRERLVGFEKDLAAAESANRELPSTLPTVRSRELNPIVCTP